MPRWNENLFPPSGFVFTDEEKIQHSGSGIDDLISKVAAYRVRRGLPPGNPVAEVHDQLCKAFPSRCLNGAPSQPAHTGPTLSDRVASWLRSVYVRVAQLRISQKDTGFIDDAESKRRATVCRACKFHSSLPSGCVACSETVNTISFQLRAGRDKHTSNLRVCAKFGTDLRVDALLVQPPQLDAPENCWKR